MSKYLYRLGHGCVRRRRTVLVAWIVVLFGVGVLASTVGGPLSDQFSIPGTESQQAMDLLDQRFPQASGSSARVVFAVDEGRLDDAGAKAGIEATLAQLGKADGVRAVSDPFEAGTVSPDGSIGFADVQYGSDASEVTEAQLDALYGASGPAEAAGVQVEHGGEVKRQEEPGHSSELIGLGVAVIVLLLSFGSLVAMGIPIVTALIGVGIGLSGITVVAGLTDVSSSAPTLATMIGLAVGIDYALFIVTRHRQNMAEGHDVAEAAARATATAGGAVVFAGMTVVIALLGVLVIGIPFLTAMGLGAALTVFLAVLIAVSLLPALLGFAGTNIDRWRIGRSRTGSAEEAEASLSGRFARRVIARPGVSLAVGLGIIAVLAVPFLSMRLGMTDAGASPKDTTERKAYDLLAEGFGPGFNGPLTLVVDTREAADPEAALTAVSAAVGDDPGVAVVGPPMANEAGDTSIVSVIPATSPSSAETEELVHHLRHDVVAPVAERTGADVAIAGQTSVLIDVADKMADALPLFMGLVIGLTMILLLVVFRSLLVPVKAAIAILLSIGASFGVLVAVFQWGWMKDLIGLQETVPIISFLPLLMFAILFGLSMDYEVFILSRIREDYVRTGDARRSVLTGLTSSARVITAAALIMISVFASFVLGEDPIIKMFGVGFATAVLLDATVVRMIVVPATMALFGDRAWWLPGWLDRIIPDLDVEGEHLIEALDHASDGSGGGDRVDDADRVPVPA
ncbi:MAG TPA: MMPL family transporter [Acidimicrobiales bacterium]|nr:MMPL family transporter [Acidimicrobiales bacterium]